jgi:hypothetical protein
MMYIPSFIKIGSGIQKLLLSVCVAWQRLGKNPPIVATQQLDRNPPIVARERLGRNVTAVTNTHEQ